MKDTAPSVDWRTLCELAAKENDPQKLFQLIVQINRTLEENRRSQRLRYTNYVCPGLL